MLSRGEGSPPSICWIPKSFSVEILSRQLIPSLLCCLKIFLPRWWTWCLMKFLSTYFSSLCRSPWMAARRSVASTAFLRLLTVHSLPSSRALMKIFDSIDLWGNELVNMFGLCATDSHLTAHLSVHTSLVCLEDFWEASETLVTSRQTMSTWPYWLLMRLAFKNHTYHRTCGKYFSWSGLWQTPIIAHIGQLSNAHPQTLSWFIVQIHSSIQWPCSGTWRANPLPAFPACPSWRASIHPWQRCKW